MSLDVTVGGATANSYATLAEADAYQSGRPLSLSWNSLSDEQKESALIQATKLLNAIFKWTGIATDNIQVLSWPRMGMFTRNGFPIDPHTIPQELKDAESEYARQLTENDLSGSLEQDIEGLDSVKAGPIEIKFRKENALTVALLNAQLKLQQPDLLYLDKMMPIGVRVLLVPSWYEIANVLQKAFLRARR